MARSIRLEFPDAAYHVTARGNEHREIVRDDRDRTQFLEVLGEAVRRFGVLVHAYCVMPNHYHLVVQTPRANVSAAIGWLQAKYAIRFNRRHERDGHLFGQRFKAQLIEEDAYAQELVKYIHLNPVRPKDRTVPIPVERKQELALYPWSSHRAYAGVLAEDPPNWLCLEWQRYFGRTRSEAQAEYQRQIDAAFGQAVRSPWEDLLQGIVLGNEAFRNRAHTLSKVNVQEEEIRWQRRESADASARLIAALAEKEQDRRIAIWLQVRLGGRRMTELAGQYGYRDGSGIHRVVQRLDEEAKSNGALARRLNELATEVRAMLGVP